MNLRGTYSLVDKPYWWIHFAPLSCLCGVMWQPYSQILIIEIPFVVTCICFERRRYR